MGAGRRSVHMSVPEQGEVPVANQQELLLAATIHSNTPDLDHNPVVYKPWGIQLLQACLVVGFWLTIYTVLAAYMKTYQDFRDDQTEVILGKKYCYLTTPITERACHGGHKSGLVRGFSVHKYHSEGP